MVKIKNMIRASAMGFLVLLLASCGQEQKKKKVSGEANEKEDVISDYPDAIKLTSGPKQHWFGYYDKIQMDPTGRYVLGGEVDTFFRSPTNEDVLTIGMVDLQNNNKWIPLGESQAWGWQQGCMLQWVPGSDSEIIWNDLRDGKFVSHILNIKTKKKRTLPKAIYALSHDGTFALGTEFNRIQNMRPGYGYPGVEDPYAVEKAPSEIGVYKMDLRTGDVKLLISIADMANLGENLGDYWHYFNHILVSPDNTRFTFLHRWRKEMGVRTERASGGFTTRMVTAKIDGTDRYILDPSGNTSHFVWKDPTHICMWTKPMGMDWGFYLFKDKSMEIVPVGKGIMTKNGHNTYVSQTDSDWILNDTYPNKEQLQTLYLYHVPSQERMDLGKFFKPEKFEGEWRCDLHPKTGPDGKWAIFDSTHDDDGRQMYMVAIDKTAQENN